MTKRRARRGREEWSTLLAEMRSSGQSMSAYAKAHNVSTTSLSYWAKKLTGGGAVAAPKAKRVFSEVVVVPRIDPAPTRLEVVTKGGAAVRIEGPFDAGLLRNVLRVVESC